MLAKLKPVAKAWVGAAAAAISPLVIQWVQEAGNDAVTWAVGLVTAGLAWLATWRVPNVPS